MIVVKVGGSLFDLPDLGNRLRAWLVGRGEVLLVPGGGVTADAVRELDRRQHLGEEAAHWLALRALSLNAHFLARLLAEATLTRGLDEPRPSGSAAPGTLPNGCGSSGWSILDPFPLLAADEATPDHLPHAWTVTSDSLAIRVAQLMAASEVVLLKSIAWDHARTWEEAARAGAVDAHFPSALRNASNLVVSIVNLRTHG